MVSQDHSTAEDTSAPPAVVWVRGEREAMEAARAHEAATPAQALRAALEAPGAYWLHWADRRALACLDIDFHAEGVSAPAWAALRRSVLDVGVTPRCLWRSRGGGCHALYEPAGGLAADELAAAAAVELMDALPDATFEVLSRTRAALGAEVSWHTPDAAQVLASWRARHYGIPQAETIAAYRAERGWTRKDGEHTDCPGDPARPSSRPGARPVFFGPDGVSCHSCKAHGMRAFWPWGQLISGHARPNLIRAAAERLVDLSHAQHLIADAVGPRLRPQEQRLAYYALAKLLHSPDDPRVCRIQRSPDGDFIRGEAGWLCPHTLSPVKVEKEYVRSLPYCQYVTEEPGEGDAAPTLKVQLDWTRYSAALNASAMPGWAPIVPVRGVQLWGQFQAYPGLADGVRVAMWGGAAALEPRYRVEGGRMPIEEARALLERLFPGLLWDYLLLLLVARGYAESASGRVPRVVVTGPSGAAKSTTAQLAAAVLGDEARVVPDTGEFREHLDRALSDSVGWAVCDEFAKPRRDGGRTRDPRMFLVMETRSWQARLLYIGSQSVTVRSAVVLTGVQLPRGFDDLQLARRFVHVQLPEQVGRWDETCGFGDVLRLRQHHPEACDAVLSYVVDRWFARPDPDAVTFTAAAAELGWGTVADSISIDDAFSPAAQVQALYALWAAGEGCDEPPRRWQAEGRRRFGFFDSSAIAELWRELCDGAEGAQRRSSETVSALDLRRVLDVPANAPGRIWLEVRGDKASVCIRFMRDRSPLEV